MYILVSILHYLLKNPKPRNPKPRCVVPLAVNPNSRNGKIRAPIHTARDNGHHEIVNILEPFDYDF